MTPKDQARAIWQAGVDAVGGYSATDQALANVRRPDRILAVGKAAATMAQAALDRFPGTPCLVVTKDGHGSGLPDEVELIEAAHPVPDARSLAGGRALRLAVRAMTVDSALLLLVSGGASSLAEDLVEGHDLDDLTALNTRLLAEGLDITTMNAERRKISHVKGGNLLAGFKGAQVDVLAISDVPGDDLMVIGSGIGALPDRHDFKANARIIASNAHARTAAANKASELGLEVVANSEALHLDLPTLAAQVGAQLRDMPPGVAVLGGEPTVVLPENPGQGGRNQALALALAKEIAGEGDLIILVGGTDGTDGPTDAAGGIVDGTTWSDAAEAHLKAADSGPYLARHDALLTTGPTGTNVMDLLIAIRATA
ncbi:Putative hydroxypyruvate reductase [Falsiruegeria litorea R37]|uniref:Putative hydroxypyruvate reductase n=1 Tax=Falsiruegeria litorea R37 TaxID=1200284 RepID=A0A1Y5S421_9RHOB|nr:DUF4147 domain-containing protein [Falsiruegeria litorea]SLN30731.1 Putative hydroxypyruvate reductase [Falsiruegeria litorea R37]